MTIDLANEDLIARQIAMKGLGLNIEMIAKLMGADDARIEKEIANLKFEIPSFDGAKLEAAEKFLRAMEIESEMRK